MWRNGGAYIVDVIARQKHMPAFDYERASPPIITLGSTLMANAHKKRSQKRNNVSEDDPKGDTLNIEPKGQLVYTTNLLH